MYSKPFKTLQSKDLSPPQISAPSVPQTGDESGITRVDRVGETTIMTLHIWMAAVGSL